MPTLTPERVILGYNDAVHQVRQAVLKYATTAWSSAGSWRDADVDRLVNLILPKVQAGQLQTARLTSAYVVALAKVVDRKTVRAASVVTDDILLARGVDQSVVYRRPAVEMYTALSNGSTLTQAVTQGLGRLSSIISTDMQLSVTHQERRAYKGAGYTYTVRTLTGRESCALCIIASTQRYHVSELRPIHPDCDCGSRQISAQYDPGQVLDSKLLSQAYDLLGSGNAKDATGTNLIDLIAVRQHGEIGPVLTWADQHFTGPEQLAA